MKPTHSILIALLLCLPVRGQITIDALSSDQVESKISERAEAADQKHEQLKAALAVEFGKVDAKFAESQKLSDNLQELADELLAAVKASRIRVEDMPGENINEKFRAAVAEAKRKRRNIEFPSGYRETDTTLELKYAGTPRKSRCFNGLTIYFNGMALFWNGSPNQAMIDSPSPTKCNFEGPITIVGRPIAGGPPIEGVVGWWHRASWENNANTSTGCNYRNFHFRDLDRGIYVGGPMGPDLRNHFWQNVNFYNVATCISLRGGNITNYVFDNVTIAGVKVEVGIHNIWQKVCKFADKEVLDPWGQPWSVDRYDTSDWKRRIYKRDTPDASCYAGAPVVEVRNLDMASTGRKDPSWAFWCEGSSILIDNARIEGKYARAGKFTSVGANQINNRFISVLDNMVVHGDSSPSVAKDGAPPVVFVNGAYGGTIPEADGNDVVYLGRVKAAGKLVNRTGDRLN